MEVLPPIKPHKSLSYFKTSKENFLKNWKNVSEAFAPFLVTCIFFWLRSWLRYSVITTFFMMYSRKQYSQFSKKQSHQKD